MTEGTGIPLAAIDVAILAGGLGTRLRPAVSDVPKVLAPVDGRPFLDILADWLARQGARRLVLCLGHLADKVIAHIADRPRSPLSMVPVVEPEPLGTGGALVFARPQLRSDPVMVLNGDSWIAADLGAFLAFHQKEKVLASVLCVEVPDASRYGRIELTAEGRVSRFIEKEPGPARAGLINAGVYLLAHEALEQLHRMRCRSLERDFLQNCAPGTLAAFVCRDASFVDIGTPESLAGAAGIITGANKEVS